jgi:hypothetical protein
MTMRLLYGLICLCFALAPAFAQDTGYVLQVAGRLVFVDKGEQDNMRPGDFLQIIRQEIIKHPETGENLAGEVALGVVRIVEVFPRLSTAEVVDLMRGMDFDMLDKEARQGLIRIRVLPPEAEMMILERVKARESGLMAAPDRLNPDGVLRQFVPEIRVGIGSRQDAVWPAFTYQLIDQSTIGSRVGKTNLAQPDSAFDGVLDTVLLTLADTTSTPQELEPFGGSLETQINVIYPYSERITLLADFGFGNVSRLNIGAKFYSWNLIKFLGSGYTPDGQVGTPVFTLKLGKAGKGPSKLSSAGLEQLQVKATVRGDSIYAVTALDTVLTTEYGNLSQALITHVDTLFRGNVRDMLRDVANEGVKSRNKSGLGFSLGITWPITRHFTLHGDWTRMGNIKEYGGKLTYYMRSVEKTDPRVNPDGRIRSLILSLGGRYDTGSKQSVLDFDLVFPVLQRFTFSSVVTTDFNKFTRVGLAFKTYLKGF